MESSSPSLTGTQRLAEFVSKLRYDALSAEIRESARLHLLDTIGCELAFAHLPASTAVYRYAELFPSNAGDTATIANHGRKTTMEIAALTNATFAHGFEMDDTEMSSVSHPGSVIVPAALAVAEAVAATGEELITAIVAGYEVMVRVGRAARGMELRGFHATPVAGVFGAAAATASLLRSDADTIMHALGIAASRASGIAEYGLTGGSVKRLHAGLAAQSGIQAVRLASVGMTAPTEALEGKRGIVQAVSATGRPGILTEPLTPSAVLDTGFKLYTCCAGQHTVIDAMRGLIEENPELRANTVESIHVIQNAWEAELVGTIKEPTDVVTSQFSAAFALGLRLVRGSNAITEYTEANIKNPEILGIARRVSYEAQNPDSPLEGFAPCAMSVTLKDGRVLQNAVSFARGTPQMPLSPADLEEKFFGLNLGEVGSDKAHEVVGLVANVEGLADAGVLARAMVSPTAAV